MSRLEFLVKTLFINCIISDQDDKVKTESLVPMTAPTNGTISLMPGVPKYVANAEDGEVSFCWHISTLEIMIVTKLPEQVLGLLWTVRGKFEQ